MTQGRKACLSGEYCRPTTLDEALYCVVNHTAEMDSKAIADRIGTRHGYLAAAVNPDDDTHHLQARLLLPLMTVTGNKAPVEFLARAVGGVFVPLPPTVGDDCPRTSGLAIVRQLGCVVDETEQALSDGRIDPLDAAAIQRELARLLETVQRQVAVVARLSAESAEVSQ